MSTKGLMERLRDGEFVICAEGYLFNFEKRGYLRAGAFVPEVVLEHPELVRLQYEEFVHAGSDVVQAFTYYAHRKKMSVIDREKDIEKINRDALTMAREVADKTGTLMAGNICNSSYYLPNDAANDEILKDMYKEQVQWAVEYGADFIIAETFDDYGEAKIALDICKKYAKDLPVVLTFAWHLHEVDGEPATLDGVKLTEVFPRLEAAGADVLGLNCARGPATMLPLMERIKQLVKVPLAAVPVMFRTTKAQQNMQSLTDPDTGKRCFYANLDCMQLTREDVHNFGLRCKELGIQYVGLCCGNSAHYTRALSESLGKKPPASRYTVNMHDHYLLGKSDKICDRYGEGKGVHACVAGKVSTD